MWCGVGVCDGGCVVVVYGGFVMVVVCEGGLLVGWVVVVVGRGGALNTVPTLQALAPASTSS